MPPTNASRSRLTAASLPLLVLLAIACDRPAPTGASPPSSPASNVVAGLRARFSPRAPSAIARLGVTGAAPTSVLRASTVDRLDDAGRSALTPHFRGGEAREEILLPRRADGDLALTDVASRAHVAIRLNEATGSPAELGDGYVVHRGALSSGADMVRRPSTTGVDDLFVFERAPERARFTYDVSFSPEVAGLRLTHDALELLDARGTPLLHSAPPFVTDREGTVTAASLTVSGCDVDRSENPPWRRRVTPPGAAHCLVSFTWDGAHVAYPAVLDPTWTTARAMTAGSAVFASAVLSTGSPLVAAIGGPLPCVPDHERRRSLRRRHPDLEPRSAAPRRARRSRRHLQPRRRRGSRGGGHGRFVELSELHGAPLARPLDGGALVDRRPGDEASPRLQRRSCCSCRASRR